MKILADESMEGEIVAALREGGHIVSDIKEMSPGIDDERVLELAKDTNALLLTNDKDFGELIYRDRHFSTGVVLLRFGKLDIGERIELLMHVLQDRADDLLGSFTVISPVGVRIRRDNT